MASGVSQRGSFIWPEDGHGMHITGEEKRVLEEKIRQLQARIPSYRFSEGADGPILAREKFSRFKLRVSDGHAFVLLKSPEDMSKFEGKAAQQEKIKYAWDCRTGSLWLKKKMFGHSGSKILTHLKGAPEMLSHLSLPELVIDETKEKTCYFEKKASYSLSEWLQDFPLNMEAGSILGLLHALRKIHAEELRIPFKDIGVYSSGILNLENASLLYRLFHGAICPQNLVCEKILLDGNPYPRWKLTGFSHMGDPTKVVRTPGWEPPEYVQWAGDKNDSHYSYGAGARFVANHGAKRDTWAMGLLIGSLLQQNFAKGFLPYFDFIFNKLELDESGHVIDQSEITTLTQKEIDAEIDALIEAEPNAALKTVWECVKRYLRVDPEERPTADTLCLQGNLKD